MTTPTDIPAISNLLREAIKRLLCETDFRKQEVQLSQLFNTLDALLPAQGDVRQHQFGETGMLISSVNAANCLRGPVRTLCYWRSLLIALEKLVHQASRPIRILYPGCGPFATLVLPLLVGVISENIEIQFIEINQQSVNSLRQLMTMLQRPNLQCQVTHSDVLDFQSSENFDLMISECMLASLQEEGQVAITYHLSQFLAPHAIVIPETIKVDLCWTDADKEFSYANQYRERGKGLSAEQLSPFRTRLVSLISLDKSVRQRYIRTEELLLLGEFEIEPFSGRKKFLIYCTTIHFIDDIRLQEYEDGLTSPMVAHGPGIESGMPLEVKFRLLKSPGFEFLPKPH